MSDPTPPEPPEPPEQRPILATSFTGSVIREGLKPRFLVWMLVSWALLLPQLFVAPLQTGPFLTAERAQLFLTSCVLVWRSAVGVFVQAAVAHRLLASADAGPAEGEPGPERRPFPWGSLVMLSAILGLIEAVLIAVLTSLAPPADVEVDSGAALLSLAIVALQLVTRVLFLLAPVLVVFGSRAETALLDSLRLVSKQFWWIFVSWVLVLLVSAVPLLPVFLYQAATVPEQGAEAAPIEPTLPLEMIALVAPAIYNVLIGIAITKVAPLLMRQAESS